MNDNQLFRRNQEMIHTEIDNEIVMMSIENQAYFGLDEIGALIWNRSENIISINDLIPDILKTYEVDEAILRKDLNELLESMLEKNLIVLC